MRRYSCPRRALIYLWDDSAVAEASSAGLSHSSSRTGQPCAAAQASQRRCCCGASIRQTSATRPALQRLRQAIERRDCEVLIIPALISLGPAVADILALLELLGRRGLDLISLHESLDTASGWQYCYLFIH